MFASEICNKNLNQYPQTLWLYAPYLTNSELCQQAAHWDLFCDPIGTLRENLVKAKSLESQQYLKDCFHLYEKIAGWTNDIIERRLCYLEDYAGDYGGSVGVCPELADYQDFDSYEAYIEKEYWTKKEKSLKRRGKNWSAAKKKRIQEQMRQKPSLDNPLRAFQAAAKQAQRELEFLCSITQRSPVYFMLTRLIVPDWSRQIGIIDWTKPVRYSIEQITQKQLMTIPENCCVCLSR